MRFRQDICVGNIAAVTWAPQHITSVVRAFSRFPRISGERLNHLLRWHSPGSSVEETSPSVKGTKGYIIWKTNSKVKVGPLFKNDEEIQEKTAEYSAE